MNFLNLLMRFLNGKENALSVGLGCVAIHYPKIIRSTWSMVSAR